jgi:hypothetical protein
LAKLAIGSPAWMRPASLIGMPTSCAMVLASSSARAFSPSEIFCSNSQRSSTGVSLHASSAVRAAATAASTSFCPPAGTFPIASPLPALCTSIDSLLEGATHWPAMKNLSRFSMCSPFRSRPEVYSRGRGTCGNRARFP